MTAMKVGMQLARCVAGDHVHAYRHAPGGVRPSGGDHAGSASPGWPRAWPSAAGDIPPRFTRDVEAAGCDAGHAGGHDVPDEKLEARFERTLANLERAINALPVVVIFDNTNLAQPFQLEAVSEKGRRIGP
jgi:hypothetical protein